MILSFDYLTKSRFPGRINSAWLGVGITLIYKVNCHIVSDFPDFLGFQVALEIGHGRAGNAVHNLVIQDAARDAASF